MNFNYVLARENHIDSRIQCIGKSDFYSYCLRVLFGCFTTLLLHVRVCYMCLTFWPSVVQVRKLCVKTFPSYQSQTHTRTHGVCVCMWVTKSLRGILSVRIHKKTKKNSNKCIFAPVFRFSYLIRLFPQLIN